MEVEQGSSDVTRNICRMVLLLLARSLLLVSYIEKPIYKSEKGLSTGYSLSLDEQVDSSIEKQAIPLLVQIQKT